MQLSFYEELTGQALISDKQHPIHLRVAVSSETLRALGGWSPLHLEGKLTLGTLAQDAAIATGSVLEIGLPFHNHIAYKLFFRDDAEKLWRFFPRSRLRLPGLLSALTTFEGPLFCNGESAGTGRVTLRPTLRRSFKHLLAHRFRK